jgi:hypothetical protein
MFFMGEFFLFRFKPGLMTLDVRHFFGQGRRTYDYLRTSRAPPHNHAVAVLIQAWYWCLALSKKNQFEF